MKLNKIRLFLKENSNNNGITRFFKTGEGSYSEHDKFLGTPVPIIRKIAQEFKNLSLEEIKELLRSPFNEERLLALIILANQYKKGDSFTKEIIYSFYRHNLEYVNNWNLVDTSADKIVGDYLFDKDRTYLIELAGSKNIWHRRIAIISTLYFIRKNDLEWTFIIAELLINDKHDLIHKAVGWMLREAGKKDNLQLLEFLDYYGKTMPRTMLRYAIEKLSKEKRIYFLK